MSYIEVTRRSGQPKEGYYIKGDPRRIYYSDEDTAMEAADSYALHMISAVTDNYLDLAANMQPWFVVGCLEEPETVFVRPWVFAQTDYRPAPVGEGGRIPCGDAGYFSGWIFDQI